MTATKPKSIANLKDPASLEAAFFLAVATRDQARQNGDLFVGDMKAFGEEFQHLSDNCDRIAEILERNGVCRSNHDIKSLSKLGYHTLEEIRTSLSEGSYDIDLAGLIERALELGLVAQVTYDPDVHENVLNAEPGDQIYYWGATAIGSLHPRINFDPNLVGCGDLVTQKVRVTLGEWSYRRIFEVDCTSSFLGFDVFESAIDQVFDQCSLIRSGEREVAEVTLVDIDSEEKLLICTDDEDAGADWIKSMVIAIEVVSLNPVNDEKGQVSNES
ncbi:DUF5406 family protein [Roseiconus lacunae]|uniref:DUF5406 family protein n=1 Tax=Roseiconus lacunae TaxID=2605694 RepID=UPI001E390CC7|nr:DUF5406 family protein [Roseiconus lacunae]MCD0459158.1 DUF5406 domain-containing protein [Roseiconus lacunae]